MGSAPTLTLSKTPSSASARASSPARVLEILALNIMPLSVSTRSATIPMGLVRSWFSMSLGAGPSTGREPGMNLTRWPSETVATTS